LKSRLEELSRATNKPLECHDLVLGRKRNNPFQRGFTSYNLSDCSAEKVMNPGLAGGEKIAERLQESLDQLRKDIDRVELWASALDGFSRPIPSYDPALRYKLAPGNVCADEKKERE
jgi:hypothetical protein